MMGSGDLMGNLGLLKLIDWLERGDPQRQEAAVRLRELVQRSAPFDDIVSLLRGFERAGTISTTVLTCLCLDLAAEIAGEKAEADLGGGDAFAERCAELFPPLTDRIFETINSFLAKHPIPEYYLIDVFDDVIETWRERVDRSKILPTYSDQHRELTNRYTLGVLRSHALAELAERVENDSERLSQIKQEGEKELIGMTYE